MATGAILAEPSGFSWTSPVTIERLPGRGVRTTPTDFSTQTTVPSTGTTYYVDPVNGNDGNTGTARDDAFMSVNVALGQADIDVLALWPGLYEKDVRWGSGVTPTRDLYVYVLDNGFATMSSHEASLSWVNHSGSAWKVTRGGVDAVWDTINRGPHGDYGKLAEESSAANVVTRPGSWYLDVGGGNVLYVHLIDGREPESTYADDVFVSLAVTGSLIQANINVYVENVNFEGGSQPMAAGSPTLLRRRGSGRATSAPSRT